MKARIAVVALSGCLAGALGHSTAAPVPKDKAVLYHPTRVGAKWVYRSDDREWVAVGRADAPRLRSSADRSHGCRTAPGGHHANEVGGEAVVRSSSSACGGGV